MKVIKIGKTKDGLCEECGCEFEYEGKDVQKIKVGYLSIIKICSDEYYLRCPSCRAEIVVGEF